MTHPQESLYRVKRNMDSTMAPSAYIARDPKYPLDSCARHVVQHVSSTESSFVIVVGIMKCSPTI